MNRKEYEDELDARVADIRNNSLEIAEVLMQLDSALEEIEHLREPYPLQTIQSLADRWGVTRQLVNFWRTTHADFPTPQEGMITPTAKTPLLFSIKEVEQYEKAHRKAIAENRAVQLKKQAQATEQENGG